jgi:hypothetical protein
MEFSFLVSLDTEHIHYATNLKIAVSTPEEVTEMFT